jgi:malonyl-CoA decarboxylase
LQNFVTLAPMPGFARWLEQERGRVASPYLTQETRRALGLLDHPNWVTKAAAIDALNRCLPGLAANYLVNARTASGRILDPVARFHLGNGARLERLNPLGDLSAAALRQSHGMMVNYLYDLDHIEENHEAFANKGEVLASAAIRRLARVKPREAMDEPARAT